MPARAADDFDMIALTVTYEDGFRAGCNGAERTPPAGCKNFTRWYAGYDEGIRLSKAAKRDE